MREKPLLACIAIALLIFSLFYFGQDNPLSLLRGCDPKFFDEISERSPYEFAEKIRDDTILLQNLIALHSATTGERHVVSIRLIGALRMKSMTKFLAAGLSHPCPEVSKICEVELNEMLRSGSGWLGQNELSEWWEKNKDLDVYSVPYK